MSYLLDTNIISELTKKVPTASVVEWLAQCEPDELYISVLSMGEIRKGVTKMTDMKRQMTLLRFLEHDMQTWFGDRVLAIDLAVANTWGRLCGQIKNPVPAIDSLIAATAVSRQLTLVTRNIKDFSGYGLALINHFL